MNTNVTRTQVARHFLLALLADLASDKNFRRCFKAAHRELHYFFWKIKQGEETRGFVADLLFDTNGNFPHSEKVDEILQEFQLSGILARPNPTYRYNDITIMNSPSADEFKKNLKDEQKKVYDQVLEDFKKELGVRDS
jgi:Zn-dependent oligopeptidase